MRQIFIHHIHYWILENSEYIFFVEFLKNSYANKLFKENPDLLHYALKPLFKKPL